MKQIIKDILIMLYEFIGIMIIGTIFVLSDPAVITSYAVKEFAETTISIFSILGVGFLILCMGYYFWKLEC